MMPGIPKCSVRDPTNVTRQKASVRHHLLKSSAEVRLYIFHFYKIELGWPSAAAQPQNRSIATQSKARKQIPVLRGFDFGIFPLFVCTHFCYQSLSSELKLFLSQILLTTWRLFLTINLNPPFLV